MLSIMTYALYSLKKKKELQQLQFDSSLDFELKNVVSKLLCFSSVPELKPRGSPNVR